MIWTGAEERRDEKPESQAREPQRPRDLLTGKKGEGGEEKNTHESVPTNLGNNNNQISKNEDGEGNIGGAM